MPKTTSWAVFVFVLVEVAGFALDRLGIAAVPYWFWFAGAAAVLIAGFFDLRRRSA